LVKNWHYNPSVSEAFDSVEHIMRDVNNGWLIRYLHSNTASAFFFLVGIFALINCFSLCAIFFIFIENPLKEKRLLDTYIGLASRAIFGGKGRGNQGNLSSK